MILDEIANVITSATVAEGHHIMLGIVCFTFRAKIIRIGLPSCLEKNASCN